MTALQGWLTATPLTPHTIRNLIFAPLRVVLPGRPAEADREPQLLRPGTERC